jgi:hypothetical protein
MPNLIKLDTKEYPVSIEEFRHRFKNTSFTAQIPFADLGYAVVFPAPQPAHNPATHIAQEVAPVQTHKGHFEQRWEIIKRERST